MAYEDLTQFIKVDTAGDITVNSATKATVDTMRRAVVDGLLYKDYGGGAFGDFEIDFKITLTGHNGTTAAGCGVLTLSNTLGTIQDCIDATDGITVFPAWDGSQWQIYLYKLTDESSDNYGAGTTTPKTLYCTFTRSGTSGQIYIYSDAERTNLLDTVALTVPSTPYRYFYAVCGRDAANYPDETISLEIENIEIKSGGTSTTTTTTTTAPPGSSTTTTQDPCLTGYGWAYEAPNEFNDNESLWAGRTLRYVIPADKLRVSGSTVKVFFAHAGTDYDISKAYIGHQAASGHPYDFDGNQAQLTFDGGSAGATVSTPGKWSDAVNFNLDAKKAVIVAVYFGSNGIPAGLADQGVDSWWKDGDDAATTDASGYTLRAVDLQRVIDLICASAGITTTTTTTTTSSTTTTTTPESGEGTTTTSKTTTTTTATQTGTTTTSGPYWAWYQDKPVLLVEPNWLEPPADALVDPYKVTGWYGTEYAYGHYGEGEAVLDLQFTRDGLEEIRGFYDFFDLNRGRLGGFWLPTWKSDALITEAFDAADTVLTVKDLKWESYYKGKAAPQYLFFIFPDGTWAARKLVSATASAITLDSAIGKTVTEAALGLVLASFLFYGRFEQDVLEMEYASAETASCVLTFHSLPTGTPGVITTTTTTVTTTSSTTTTTT